MSDFSFPQTFVDDCPNGSDIIAECRDICELLLIKNRAYGSSVFKGPGIFSKLSPVEAINARIDDKLARIRQAKDFSEDTELDLIGYLILKRIAMQSADTAPSPKRCGFHPGFGRPCRLPGGHKGVHDNTDESGEPLFRPSVEEVRDAKDQIRGGNVES